MFTDVSGFTALGEQHDPEALQQLMMRFIAEMSDVITRHGGTIGSLGGDSIMAAFGVPTVHEDDALRAARAALGMQAALGALNDELGERWDVVLRTHTGINTGEVVVGESANGDLSMYGDAVNVAKRLEDAAEEGEIFVGEVTARLLDGVARLTPLIPLRIKGKAAPVAAWRLDGVGDDGRRPPGPIAELIGRSRELERLRAAFERVAGARSPEMVTVVGAAGIGKSRLVRAFLEDIDGRATVLAGRCLPYGEGITYWPLAEIVRRLAGRPEERAIADAVGDDADARIVAHRIARVVGIAPGSVAPDEAHWAVRRMLEIRAATRPVVVVIDDLHWAEPTLLEVLAHVVTHAAEVPLLVLGQARPDLLAFREDWATLGGRSSVLSVEPLADADAAALLERLTEADPVDAEDAAELLVTAEGNPFFLEQVVAMRAEPGEQGARTPASIQALLAARIDALPPRERAVLERAAVEGRGFHRSAVAELLPVADRAGVDAILDALARRQLIRPGRGELPGEAGYHFAHILIRDVAYQLLPKASRAELHERYAGWLDRRSGARYGEIVGYHLEQAHRLHAELRPRAAGDRRALANGAARRLSAAGHAALDRGDLHGGANLLERTAALLPPDDTRRVQALSELGLAQVELARFDDAEESLGLATRLAAERGDAAGEAHARTAQFFAVVQRDPEDAAGELQLRFELLRRTFTDASDDLGLARLWRAQALVHWLLGNTTQAEAAWTRAVRHAIAAGDEPSRADALVWLSSAQFVGPKRVPEAIRRCEAILDQLEYDRRSQALALRPLAALHAMAGRFGIARELMARGNQIHRELGLSMHTAASEEEGIVAMLEGDFARAVAVLRPACEYLLERNERALLSTSAGMLARALVEVDEVADAWAFTHVAEDAAAPDDRSAQIVYRTVRARLLAREGAHEEADRLSAEAVEIAAETDWLVDQGDAYMARGEVLRADGRLGEAACAMHEAVERYTRKGNAVSAQRARAEAESMRRLPRGAA
jgi:predicted ATPase/class 3 adenylate cyclase